MKPPSDGDNRSSGRYFCQRRFHFIMFRRPPTSAGRNDACEGGRFEKCPKDPFFFLSQNFPPFSRTWWKLTEVRCTELPLGWGHFTSNSGNIASIFGGLYSLFSTEKWSIRSSMMASCETRIHIVHHRLMNKWNGEQLLSAKFVFFTMSLSFWERWL